MSLTRISSRNSQVPKPSSFGEPLVVRMFGEEILEIFLDKAAFLVGILSNREEGILRRRVSFLPLQPVLPEQIGILQKLLSPDMSLLRMKHLNVIEVEPKLLGGGTKTEIDPKVKTARELFLILSGLTQENIEGIKQREIFDKIRSLSKALPSLSNYKDQLADAWYVAKVLHMAIDVLLLTIWVKEKGDSQNTRYSFEQKEAILTPLRNAKKILEKHSFPMKEATLLSLDLTEIGVQLLPESDMKPKDWKVFIHIGQAINSSFAATDSIERGNSQRVSKLLTDLWLSLGGYWAVSPNLYGYSTLARFLPLNKSFEAFQLINSLKCSSADEFTNTESEENSDPISQHLLAFDRLTDMTLYESREELREQAFHAISPWAKFEHETLRKSAILSLKQISLLSQDSLIRKKASEVLDAISLSHEVGLFLSSYQKWVVDNLPRGYLDEENLKIEQALQMATDQRSLDVIKRLSFCAPEEPIPPFFLEDEVDSFGATPQKMVDLRLIEENNNGYKISKKTQDRLKKFISERDEIDEQAVLGLAGTLNRAWNFDETNLDTLTSQTGNIPLHIESFVENILKRDEISDPLRIASIVFLKRLGLYHLFVKKDLVEAVDRFRKALDSFDFLDSEVEEESFSEFTLPKKEDIKYLFYACYSLKKSGSEIDFSSGELDLCSARFLSLLIRTFSDISSLKLQHFELSDEVIDVLALGIRGSKLFKLNLYWSRMSAEGVNALVFALPKFQIAHLDLEQSKLGDADAKVLAAVLPQSQLIYLNLGGNKQLGAEGAKALAAALPASQLTNLNLRGNRHLGDEGAKALADALPASRLTNLNLGLNSIRTQGAKALATSLPTSRLTSLNLQGNQIGPEGAEALATALLASQLTNLDLQVNQIGDRGANAVAAALSTSQLTSLTLNYNDIGLEGAKALAKALLTSQLTNLDLEGNQIGAEGAKTFADALRTSQLTDLNLTFNKIGDKGAMALAAALPSSKLTKMNLSRNKIYDEGATALADSLPNSKLTSLNLYHSIKIKIINIFI